MSTTLKTEKQALDFFTELMNEEKPDEIILYHNQRKTVLEVLKKAAENSGRKFMEKDISGLGESSLSTKMFEDNVPPWLADVFKKCDKCKHVVYFREYDHAPRAVQNEVHNLFVKRKIEDSVLPDNALLIIGVQDEDGVGAISRAKTVKFYKV